MSGLGFRVEGSGTRDEGLGFQALLLGSLEDSFMVLCPKP